MKCDCGNVHPNQSNHAKHQSAEMLLCTLLFSAVLCRIKLTGLGQWTGIAYRHTGERQTAVGRVFILKEKNRYKILKTVFRCFNDSSKTYSK